MGSAESNHPSTTRRWGRFLFVVGEHTGHLHAVLGVARRLQLRGHQVAFLSAGSPAAIEAAGFSHLPAPWLDSPDEDALFKLPKPARLAEFDRWLSAAEQGAAAVAATFKPDLLLFQPFQLGVYPFFQRQNLPAVSFSTKPLLSYDPWVPPYTCGLKPTHDWQGRGRVEWEWWRMRARYLRYRVDCLWQQWRYGISHRSALLLAARHTGFCLKQENRTRPLAFDLSFRSVPELVLHAAEFDFPRARPLPTGVAYLGPCLDLQRATQAFTPPPGEGPLIYCNLGTVGKQMSPHKLALYQSVLQAVLAASDWRLVLATGHAEAALHLKQSRSHWPERIQITEWAPQLSAMAQAHLLINHGGANSTKEALWCGVPLLVLPQYADQPGMAARIAYHGLGLVADPATATATSLHAQIQQILGRPEFARQAAHFQRVFRNYEEEGKVALILEQYAGLPSQDRLHDLVPASTQPEYA